MFNKDEEFANRNFPSVHPLWFEIGWAEKGCDEAFQFDHHCIYHVCERIGHRLVEKSLLVLLGFDETVGEGSRTVGSPETSAEKVVDACTLSPGWGIRKLLRDSKLFSILVRDDSDSPSIDFFSSPLENTGIGTCSSH